MAPSSFLAAKDGAALIADYKKVLRTFNAEFEHIRKRMRVSNAEASTDKLWMVHDQLENLGEAVNVTISGEYYGAKSYEMELGE